MDRVRMHIWGFLTFVLEFVCKHIVTNNVEISFTTFSSLSGSQVVVSYLKKFTLKLVKLHTLSHRHFM